MVGSVARERKHASWDPHALPDLSGRSYLVTGATAGIGFFASVQLAEAGAEILLTGRNPNRLLTAKEALLRLVPDARAQTLLLDTSNLGSVRAAAATIRMRARLDGLLLNAGIVHPPRTRQTTYDGHELVLATNALGHFVLGGELLPFLTASSGRLVWLGSLAAQWRYDPVDPELTETYTPWRAYVQSKITTTALGLEADRRLRAAGVPVSSLVAHPGYSISGRTRTIRGVNEPSRRARFVDNLQAAFTQSKEAGAWAPVRALVDPEARGGDIFGPSGRVKGSPVRTKTSALAADLEVGERLWRFCESSTGVPWPLPHHRSA